MECAEVLDKLRAMANPAARAGMARFGINAAHAYGGMSTTTIRKMAREIGKDHALAGQLWKSGIHEARTLAALVDDPKLVTEEQMDAWVGDLDSWDVCDHCCTALFQNTEPAYEKAAEWSSDGREFVKRAGFALIARLAVSDKKAPDEKFEALLPVIRRESGDDRNYVKKAVNWALRQIGKRNLNLNRLAVETAQEVRGMDSRSARWIAADALRELTGEPVQRRLRRGRETGGQP